ncbi:MAG TPA: DUF4350 domain-containing protein, partial [Cellvibrionaceae bacterium]|nr:DUF4350 domain-containing protein [Cellvibrionaceae bacterium]
FYYLHTRQYEAALRTFADGKFSWQGKALGPGDSLIITDGYGSLLDAEAEHLLAWVQQGGHLIYHLGNPFVDLDRIETDPILLQLGLELIEPEALLPSAAQEPPAQKAANYVLKPSPLPACYRSTTTVSIALPDLPHPLQVDLGAGRTVLMGDDSPAPLWQAGATEESSTPAAGFSLGEGRITLLSNLSAWQNRRLHCGDHGYFLKSLLGPGGQVAWFINLDAPSLWQRLWLLAPEAVLASLLTLLAWLWQVNVRFGEPLLETTRTRRAFLDHFKAWANYLWRQPLIRAQIAALRQDCLKRAARRVPGFQALPATEQLKRIEQLSGLAPALLQQALNRPVEYQAQTITDIIAALQQLRNHL